MDVEPLAQQPSLPTAGRGDRVARTRDAIVTSTLTLAQGGEVAPIVRDIAKAAGVSARTVFQHFADTAELYVAVLDRVLALIDHGPELDLQAPLDERISAIIAHRATHYDKLRPMWTFLATLQRRSTEAADKIRQMYSVNREQLSKGFGPELSALPADKSERLLNALTLALSPEGWVVLRERLGLSPDQAREEWLFVVKAIFKDR
jgi:AcrR family transcriptional regulator